MNSEAAAYRIKHIAGENVRILCSDPDCLVLFPNQMLTARPMTQAEVNDETQERDGEAVKCDSCDETLSDFHRSLGCA